MPPKISPGSNIKRKAPPIESLNGKDGRYCQNKILSNKIHEAIAGRDLYTLELATVKKGGAAGYLKNADGFTPLFAAVSTGCLDIVKTLLLSGMDIKIHEKCGRENKTAWDLAISNASYDIARILLSHDASIYVEDGGRVLIALLDNIYNRSKNYLECKNLVVQIMRHESTDLTIECRGESLPLFLMLEVNSQSLFHSFINNTNAVFWYSCQGRLTYILHEIIAHNAPIFYLNVMLKYQGSYIGLNWNPEFGGTAMAYAINCAIKVGGDFDNFLRAAALVNAILRHPDLDVNMDYHELPMVRAVVEFARFSAESYSAEENNNSNEKQGPRQLIHDVFGEVEDGRFLDLKIIYVYVMHPNLLLDESKVEIIYNYLSDSCTPERVAASNVILQNLISLNNAQMSAKGMELPGWGEIHQETPVTEFLWDQSPDDEILPLTALNYSTSDIPGNHSFTFFEENQIMDENCFVQLQPMPLLAPLSITMEDLALIEAAHSPGALGM